MAHPNEDLVREVYAAGRRGDLDALKQYFAEDIRWHIPGQSPLAGDYEGFAQVAEGLRRVFELTGGTFRTELHDVVANDEHVVLLFTGRAEREGRQLEENVAVIHHIRDGKVTEVWYQYTDLYAHDEFLS